MGGRHPVMTETCPLVFMRLSSGISCSATRWLHDVFVAPSSSFDRIPSGALAFQVCSATSSSLRATLGYFLPCLQQRTCYRWETSSTRDLLRREDIAISTLRKSTEEPGLFQGGCGALSMGRWLPYGT